MWINTGNALERSFEFKDFVDAFSFMTKVAFAAEIQNHHPTWTNTWNKLSIRLSTHDAGDTITEKDIHLADTIDKLFNDHSFA